jgi:hypothetical protein
MWTPEDSRILAGIIGVIIGLLMIFAVVKLFTISKTLEDILAEIKDAKTKRSFPHAN